MPSFGAEISTGNITENWLFKLANDNSGFLYFAFSDVTDSGNFYHGVILNKPSIRESIDLSNSTAKTSNVSISMPDFTYQGNPISEELFGGSNHYINQTISVYSKIGSVTTQIGSFRLIDISSDGGKINISMASHRPWDFISFPQAKHPTYNVYEPTVYGDFTPALNANISGKATAAHCTVYPVPVLYFSSSKIYTLMPRSYIASDLAYLHHYAGFNQYVPLRLSGAVFTDSGNRVDSITSTTIDNSGLNLLGARIIGKVSAASSGCAFEGFITTAPSDKEITAVPLFDNQQNMFVYSPDNTPDTSETTTALYNNSSGETFYAFVQTPKKSFHLEYISDVQLYLKLVESDEHLDEDQKFTLDFMSNQFDSINDDLLSTPQVRFYDDNYGLGTGTASSATGDIVFDEAPLNTMAGLDGCMCPDELLIKCSSDAFSGRENNTMHIGSMRLHYIAAIPTLSASTGATLSALELSVEKDIETLGKMKQFYCGGNGLKHGIQGLSGNNITEIHEAHLDLLNRFVGLDVATNPATNIDGWSDLDTSKDWKIRWWQSEPLELKKGLEQLQYEGGFIFRYRADGTPQYIHIKDSHTADETLTKADMTGIQIKPSSLSNTLTKMDINYHRNAADNRYGFAVASSNSTARTNWSIQSKENIKEVSLDAYVFPEIPATPGTNPNDDFYTYYDNIFGDIKLIVSGTIVNPKYYNLEVGKVLAFSDMYPIKAFNTSWSGLKFMITGLTRTAGTLKFEAREI